MDQFSESSHQGWFSRISDSIKGILFGGILFIVSFPVLFMNEGRAIKAEKGYKEAGGAVISVASDKVDPANDGKLIHMTAMADSNATLKDPLFGIAAEKAIRLERNVELYQWEEDMRTEQKKTLGGGTDTVKTYTYTEKWSSRLIDSSNFHKPEGHKNPGEMPAKGDVQVADKVTAGAFTLPTGLVSQIGQAENLPVASSALEGVKAPLPNLVVHAGGFYSGKTPGTPAVGDARVTFNVIRPHTVSLMGVQRGSTLAPFTASTGKTILDLQDGSLTAAQMVQDAISRNSTLTWILRALGFILMAVGIGMVLRPLSVLADVIPFIGSVVGGVTGFLAILAAAGLSLVTIAVGWVFYRPLLGIPLLLLGLGGIAALFFMKQKNNT